MFASSYLQEFGAPDDWVCVYDFNGRFSSLSRTVDIDFGDWAEAGGVLEEADLLSAIEEAFEGAIDTARRGHLKELIRYMGAEAAFDRAAGSLRAAEASLRYADFYLESSDYMEQLPAVKAFVRRLRKLNL